MDVVKGLIGLVATAAIAAVIAYGVSAPRNVDNFMNQEQASLDGKSINQSMAETMAEAREEQCEQATRMAEDAWNRAMDQGTADRDASTLDELDARVSQFCN